MKKKLNHEAYQAYYNTSSANTTNCGINTNSSPMAAAGTSSSGNSGQAVASNPVTQQSPHVYGQTQIYEQQQLSGNIQQQVADSSNLDSGKTSIPSNS